MQIFTCSGMFYLFWGIFFNKKKRVSSSQHFAGSSASGSQTVLHIWSQTIKTLPRLATGLFSDCGVAKPSVWAPPPPSPLVKSKVADLIFSFNPG